MPHKDLLYTKGTRIWISDPVEVWRSVQVLEDYEPESKVLRIIDEDGQESQLPTRTSADFPHLQNPPILAGLNDLTSLSHLHEPAVLYNLQFRFSQHNTIYTYCGIVLVAINPYMKLPIYTNETIWAYRGQGHLADLDPHIFAVAEKVYTNIQRDGKHQSIIISGESGAGKTMSAKYAMRYFVTVGEGATSETQIERKVLASSPILEAIGNARTIRNDNSSRFGKFVELHFDSRCRVNGALIRTYLLEKSRTVDQSPGERNYHIFYQMCAARNSYPDLASLRLDASSKFLYTKGGTSTEIPEGSDLAAFKVTVDALKQLGLSAADQKEFFQLLSALLHLGNVDIQGDSDSDTCRIAKDDTHLKTFSELLSVDFDSMRKWLCKRKIVSVGEEFVKEMSISEGIFCRDALAKKLYADAFNWLVQGINQILKATTEHVGVVGVLDIYGFETFEKSNSFEQFCINYANEKLQQQFNQYVFKLEQEEYVREGIEWSFIGYCDNQPCIDLIESKLGILDLLDEECRVPQGSDEGWVQKLYANCTNWTEFEKPRFGNLAFIVTHFADKVEYQSNGFLEKNRDSVHPEQLRIISASKNPWVAHLANVNLREMGTTKSPSRSGGGKREKRTVGIHFRDSLTALMTSISATTPHYIRCIKPNDQKKPFVFDPHRTVEQLRACGVLETIRISAAGFHSRWTYEDFFGRYRVLCHRTKDMRLKELRATCEIIVQDSIPESNEYKFGKTKLFFRTGQVAFLEKLRNEKLTRCGVIIQKWVKRWLCQTRYDNLQRAVRGLQRFGRGTLARKAWIILKSRNEKLRTRNDEEEANKKERESIRDEYAAVRRKCEDLESQLELREESTALILALQLRLEEKYLAIERLAKIIQGHALESPLSTKRRTQDLIRLQELEMENSKLETDLSKFRYLVEFRGGDSAISLRNELAHQFRRMQEELKRMREESIQLKTILASMNSVKEGTNVSVDDDLTSMVLMTQKEMLLQLEKELQEEKTQRNDLEQEFQVELDRLKILNEELQNVLLANVKSPSSQTENVLQHQVNRLTAANLDLWGKVENLHTQVKVLERQLKAGKDGEYLGMLEYTDDEEAQIIKTLIWELEPGTVLQYSTDLPAFIIFMCVRYRAHLHHDEKVHMFLKTVLRGVKELLIDKEDFLEVSLLWLSNLMRLLDNLKQYSGIPEYAWDNTRKQNEQALKNVDLVSTYHQIFKDMIDWVYQNVIRLVKVQIQPLIVFAILEDESAISSPVTTSRSRRTTSSPSAEKSGKESDAIHTAIVVLVKKLDKAHGILLSFGLTTQVVKQIFRQIFYYICAVALNNLLLRRDLCHWSKGMQIRYNISILEEWCRKTKLGDEVTIVLDPVIQAAQLLQARKTGDDVDALCGMCDKLTVHQVTKLLNLYTPTDEFEERPSMELIRQVKVRMQEVRTQALGQEKRDEESESELLMDSKFSFPVEITFSPSSVRLEDIEIPLEFGLSALLKRM